MNLINFMEGVNILSRYYKDQEGYHLAAEHDQITLYPTDLKISTKDVERLKELGWFQSSATGQYDCDECWTTFV